MQCVILLEEQATLCIAVINRAVICFNWASHNCSFMSAGIGHVFTRYGNIWKDAESETATSELNRQRCFPLPFSALTLFWKKLCKKTSQVSIKTFMGNWESWVFCHFHQPFLMWYLHKINMHKIILMETRFVMTHFIHLMTGLQSH